MARFEPSPETFLVEELPVYLPSGTGEHTYLWIEKRSLTTWEAIATLARRLRVDERAIGCAGLKDKHALTRQWLSVPGVPPALALEAGDDQLRVLWAIPHGNKLRTGHLQGNRFEVTLTDLAPGEGPRILERLAALAREGMPNRFGDQRFGRDGDNVARGLELLRGQRRERDARRRKMWQSAAQSAVFNEVLRVRGQAGALRRVLTGDVLQKAVSGGVFISEDVAVDQARLDAGELATTGPLPGGWAREPPPDSEARALEDQAITAVGATREDFAAAGRDLPGTRRPLVIAVTAPAPAANAPSGDTSALKIAFELTAGTYATVLVEALGVVVGQPGDPLGQSMLTR
ncbi:MAG TPA: tRNA pseudouridine(13) synthase TruD [Polyangia bacterium]